jgi:hypothetical protein
MVVYNIVGFHDQKSQTLEIRVREIAPQNGDMFAYVLWIINELLMNT